MNNYNLPVLCRIEKNLLNNVAEELTSRFHNHKFIIVSDEFIYKKYASIIEKQLNEKKIENKVILVDSASYQNALKIGEKAIEEDYDSIIGIGGGKVNDTCKYASFISKKDFFSIPTTIANDGVCSPIAVLKMEDNFTKSIGTKLPTALFVDIDIILDSPMELIKAGIGDILSNYTAIYDWKLANEKEKDIANDFALLLSDMAFNMINNMQKEEKIKQNNFIRQLAEAIVLSGISMNIAGTSRPCSGSEHLFSHTIDRLYNKRNLHGYQVALGAIVSAYLQNRDYKMLINLLKRYNINVSPDNLKLNYEEFINCWIHAKESRKDRYTILDEIEDKELLIKLEEIYNIIKGEM